MLLKSVCPDGLGPHFKSILKTRKKWLEKSKQMNGKDVLVIFKGKNPKLLQASFTNRTTQNRLKSNGANPCDF